MLHICASFCWNLNSRSWEKCFPAFKIVQKMQTEKNGEKGVPWPSFKKWTHAMIYFSTGIMRSTKQIVSVHLELSCNTGRAPFKLSKLFLSLQISSFHVLCPFSPLSFLHLKLFLICFSNLYALSLSILALVVKPNKLVISLAAAGSKLNSWTAVATANQTFLHEAEFSLLQHDQIRLCRH